jgi:phosphoserine phosphatase
MPLRLAIFDLDGTLKQARDPHERLGTWAASWSFLPKKVAGELDYEEWLYLELAL